MIASRKGTNERTFTWQEIDQNEYNNYLLEIRNMEKDVNLLLATYGKYFPEESMYQVRQIFENMDPNQVSTLSMLQFKDPLMALIISLLGGGLGIDRFYIGDTTLGVLKLITCGGFSIWAIIDLFLIMGATRQKNLEKLLVAL